MQGLASWRVVYRGMVFTRGVNKKKGGVEEHRFVCVQEDEASAFPV